MKNSLLWAGSDSTAKWHGTQSAPCPLGLEVLEMKFPHAKDKVRFSLEDLTSKIIGWSLVRRAQRGGQRFFLEINA